MRNSDKTMNGAWWRRSHHLTAKSLGVNLPVESHGTSFYCVARFTINKFVVEMCNFAKYNGKAMPTFDDVRRWCDSANNRWLVTGHGDRVDTNPKERMVVMETPEKVSKRLACALDGGVIHESGHKLYTCQRDLDPDEMWAIVAPRWAVVKDWSKYVGLLLQWINLVEDIHIERNLRADFANTHTQLADLQDLILQMEGKDDDKIDELREKATPLSIVGGAFRDIGLGYNTELGRKAIAFYKEFSKEWDMVVKGPLTPLLKEAINLDHDDDLGSFRIAMSVIGVIAELAGDTPDEPENGDGGESKYDPCPKCGASPKNLVIRGVYDDYGRKVKGKAMLVCRSCGHTQIIDIDDSADGDGGSAPKGESPEFEDMGDPNDTNGGGEGSGGESGEPSDDTDTNEGDGGGESGDDTSDTDGESGGDSAGDDAGDNGDSDDSNGGGNSNKPPVFKVGDEAMFQGVKVRVTYAGAVKADGTQDVEVERC